jgi:hypothetical protein
MQGYLQVRASDIDDPQRLVGSDAEAFAKNGGGAKRDELRLDG